jgi:hypothetical protein
MIDLSPLVVLLGVLTVAVIGLTTVAVVATLELRRMVRGLETLLPQCRGAASDLRKVMRQTQQLLNRGGRAAGHVESVVERACSAAEEAMDRWTSWRSNVQEWFRGQGRNGAGSGGSRRQSRRLS